MVFLDSSISSILIGDLVSASQALGPMSSRLTLRGMRVGRANTKAALPVARHQTRIFLGASSANALN
jgi:hypothetical protein